jgi:hypothetical protein
MTPIERAIRDAAWTLRVGRDRFRRLDPRREHKVTQDVRRHFLTDPDAYPWWTSFRYESASASVKNPALWLPGVCPNQGKKIWFMPCRENMVYDSMPTVIRRVASLCPGLEYAAIDKKLGWMFVFGPAAIHATGPQAVASLARIANAG